MKIAVTLIRLVVGLLFIFSGLVKANDPHGLSYKMQEFFELWQVSQFHSWTLWISILLNAFEIIAGIALLVGWRAKLVTWALMLLIVFFTFLTGYTFITGKPATCGCFGDCIPITSKTSFLKDLALLVLIGLLIWKKEHIRPVFGKRGGMMAMALATLFAFGVQWYTLTYLPVFDCLPYKVNKNINAQMQIPAGAVPDSTEITFVYKKDGKEIEFTADNFPADFATPPYEFVKRYDKILKKGKDNIPPIKDFSLSGVTGEDSTQYVLSQPHALLVFCEDFSVPLADYKDSFEKLLSVAKERQVAVFVVTARFDEALRQFAPYRDDVKIFKCDFTAIRTAARTNPTIYFLENGTIVEKQSHHRVEKIIEEIKRVTKSAAQIHRMPRNFIDLKPVTWPPTS